MTAIIFRRLFGVMIFIIGGSRSSEMNCPSIASKDHYLDYMSINVVGVEFPISFLITS